MSIHWWPRILLEENRDAIDRINRRIGYRLQVSGISWPESVKMGEPLEIRSAWSNAGVAPCYRGGHPCFTLKDDKGGIVSALVVDDFDLRSLPVCEAGKTEERQIVSTFRIAPRYADKAGTFFRACKPRAFTTCTSRPVCATAPRSTNCPTTAMTDGDAINWDGLRLANKPTDTDEGFRFSKRNPFVVS